VAEIKMVWKYIQHAHLANNHLNKTYIRPRLLTNIENSFVGCWLVSWNISGFIVITNKPISYINVFGMFIQISSSDKISYISLYSYYYYD